MCEFKCMKKLLVIIFLVTATLAVWAQTSNPLRLEIPAPSGSDPFNYVAAGKYGICVFFPTVGQSGKDSISWSFMMTDNLLKEKWQRSVPLHKDVTYLKSLSTKEAVYLLFHDTKRNNDGNIFVFMIIPRLQVITEHRGSIPE